ncbi:hypothetical protein CbuK_1755 [Coxiella burnetii CbuK_Q154]|nr:hypothetical protein CbuK_1755 [Coxiella burnetii CbuK_Q154]
MQGKQRGSFVRTESRPDGGSRASTDGFTACPHKRTPLLPLPGLI